MRAFVAERRMLREPWFSRDRRDLCVLVAALLGDARVVFRADVDLFVRLLHYAPVRGLHVVHGGERHLLCGQDRLRLRPAAGYLPERDSRSHGLQRFRPRLRERSEERRALLPLTAGAPSSRVVQCGSDSLARAMAARSSMVRAAGLGGFSTT